jgi:hypothetical protein
MTTFARTAVLKAADSPKQLLSCVVLAPGVEDLQGDILTADEIEKAAHEYAIDSRIIGAEHAKDKSGNIVKADASMVETFIAPADFVVGTETITKGSWVMTIKVHDDALWAAVEKGEVDGLSIGGEGVRTQISDG